MKLSEFIRGLAHGDLNNFYSQESGTVDSKNLPRVLTAINQSLIEIYTRFVLEEKTVYVLCFANKTTYQLHPKFAISNTAEDAPKFILDTQDYPFSGDVVQILRVEDELGNVLTTNDRNLADSFKITKFDTIYVHKPLKNKLLIVTYQALHPQVGSEVDIASESYQKQEIQLTPVLLEALRVKTVSNFFSTMTGKDYAHKQAVLDSKFEILCQAAEEKNLLNGSSIASSFKLESRGFV